MQRLFGVDASSAAPQLSPVVPPQNTQFYRQPEEQPAAVPTNKRPPPGLTMPPNMEFGNNGISKVCVNKLYELLYYSCSSYPYKLDSILLHQKVF